MKYILSLTFTLLIININAQNISTFKVGGKLVIKPTIDNLIALHDMSTSDWVAQMKALGFIYGGVSGNHDYFTNELIDTQECHFEITKYSSRGSFQFAWTDTCKRHLIFLDLVAELSDYDVECGEKINREDYATESEYEKALNDNALYQRCYKITRDNTKYTFEIYRHHIFESVIVSILWEPNSDKKYLQNFVK
jgi:hypothetical protein